MAINERELTELRSLVSRVQSGDIDTSDNGPLTLAAKLGELDIVKYLVSSGFNINNLDNDQVSPLYSACGRFHYNVVEYLLTFSNININLIIIFSVVYYFALVTNLKLVTVHKHLYWIK